MFAVVVVVAVLILVVVAVLLLVGIGASVEGGTTDCGDGPSATGSNDETPPPLVRRKGAPRRAVRVDFFTGDLLVWEAGVRRKTAPHFCLFESPPLVVYESCTLRSRESAPATETVAAATAAPSPEREGAGVDRLHGDGDGEREKMMRELIYFCLTFLFCHKPQSKFLARNRNQSFWLEIAP